MLRRFLLNLSLSRPEGLDELRLTVLVSCCCCCTDIPRPYGTWVSSFTGTADT